MKNTSYLKAFVYVGEPCAVVPDFLLDNDAPGSAVRVWEDCGDLCVTAWIAGSQSCETHFVHDLEDAYLVAENIAKKIFWLVDEVVCVRDGTIGETGNA